MNKSSSGASELVATLQNPPFPLFWINRIGTGLSIACAIHCMAMPLLVAQK